MSLVHYIKVYYVDWIRVEVANPLIDLVRNILVLIKIQNSEACHFDKFLDF